MLPSRFVGLLDKGGKFVLQGERGKHHRQIAKNLQVDIFLCALRSLFLKDLLEKREPVMNVYLIGLLARNKANNTIRKTRIESQNPSFSDIGSNRNAQCTL